MKKNIGNADRTIRVLLAIAIFILYFTNVIYGGIGLVLLAFAGVFLITAIVGFCPLYMLARRVFGSQNKEAKHQKVSA